MQSNRLQFRISTSRSCSGMPLLAGSISFQDAHSGSGLRRNGCSRSWNLAYIDSDLSMQTHVQLSVAGCLRSCASCAAFGDWFRLLCISHWSLPLFYRGWITVMRHLLASRPACLTVSSLSSTQLPGLLLDFGAWSILQTLLPVFTGYEHPRALSSNWQLSSISTVDTFIPLF